MFIGFYSDREVEIGLISHYSIPLAHIVCCGVCFFVFLFAIIVRCVNSGSILLVFLCLITHWLQK